MKSIGKKNQSGFFAHLQRKYSKYLLYWSSAEHPTWAAPENTTPYIGIRPAQSGLPWKSCVTRGLPWKALEYKLDACPVILFFTDLKNSISKKKLEHKMCRYITKNSDFEKSENRL